MTSWLNYSQNILHPNLHKHKHVKVGQLVIPAQKLKVGGN
jgi:hypothetical protein